MPRSQAPHEQALARQTGDQQRDGELQPGPNRKKRSLDAAPQEQEQGQNSKSVLREKQHPALALELQA